jgi:hypothetical protein
MDRGAMALIPSCGIVHGWVDKMVNPTRFPLQFYVDLLGLHHHAGIMAVDYVPTICLYVISCILKVLYELFCYITYIFGALSHVWKFWGVICFFINIFANNEKNACANRIEVENLVIFK